MIELKDIVKKHGAIWVAVVLIMGATGCATSTPNSTSSNPGAYATTQGQTAQGQGTATVSSQQTTSSQTGGHAQQTQPTINKEVFRQIEHGMTYEEVFSLVGGPGTIVAKEGNPGDPLYTVTYQYKSSDSPNTYIKLIFRSGKLLNKEMTND